MNSSARVIGVRSLAIAGLLLAAALAIPASAEAHALFGDYDPDRPLWKYLTLGFGHMVGGWDHLLFIAGVVLLAGNWRSAAKLVSLFVAGHSLTLLVATVAGWKLNATVVDVVIALSLVYVGVQGIRGRPESLRVFGTVVFVFGLVHGLGLSTRLQDLGLPDDGVVIRVILFNIGVEVGQLTALAIIVGLGVLLARFVRDRVTMARYGFGLLAAAGLVAAAILSFQGAEETAETPQVAQEEEAGQTLGTACTQTESEPPEFIGGGHPEKQFFGPDETAPVEDLVHVVGDGIIVVRYRPDLADADVRELRGFVTGDQSQYVIGAPDPEQTEPLRAVAALRTLTCAEVDMEGLAAFRDDWLGYLQAQRGIAPSG